MKRFPQWTAIGCLSLCYALAGCGDGGGGAYKTAEELKKERPAVVKKDHGHDHDHDHGHHHHAPHHGSLTMLGNHVAQIELVSDPETGKVQAFILDSEAEKPLTADQPELDITVSFPMAKEPLPLKLKPVDASKPEEGFETQSDTLKGVKAFTGTLASLKLGEKTHEKIAIEFDVDKAAKEAEAAHEHGHDDHDHAHGDKHADEHKEHGEAGHDDKDHDDKDHDHKDEHKDEHSDAKPVEKK